MPLSIPSIEACLAIVCERRDDVVSPTDFPRGEEVSEVGPVAHHPGATCSHAGKLFLVALTTWSAYPTNFSTAVLNCSEAVVIAVAASSSFASGRSLIARPVAGIFLCDGFNSEKRTQIDGTYFFLHIDRKYSVYRPKNIILHKSINNSVNRLDFSGAQK